MGYYGGGYGGNGYTVVTAIPTAATATAATAIPTAATATLRWQWLLAVTGITAATAAIGTTAMGTTAAIGTTEMRTHGGHRYHGNRHYGNRSYSGQRRHHYYDRYLVEVETKTAEMALVSVASAAFSWRFESGGSG